MDAYSRYIIQTCHRRRVHAMGGMSAFIPIKGDENQNRLAMEKVSQDKVREVKNGHDGTWVAHPGLVDLAMRVFNEHMPSANNYQVKRELEVFRAQDFLQPVAGKITEAGLRLNINVGVQYLESWLRGVGAAAIHNLMEDAATAEISRSQLWQWIRHKSQLDDGRKISAEFFREIFKSELERVKNEVGGATFSSQTMKTAILIFESLVLEDQFQEFLTTAAYDQLI
jgi:malate synthase